MVNLGTACRSCSIQRSSRWRCRWIASVANGCWNMTRTRLARERHKLDCGSPPVVCKQTLSSDKIRSSCCMHIIINRDAPCRNAHALGCNMTTAVQPFLWSKEESNAFWCKLKGATVSSNALTFCSVHVYYISTAQGFILQNSAPPFLMNMPLDLVGFLCWRAHAMHLTARPSGDISKLVKNPYRLWTHELPTQNESSVSGYVEP